MTFVDIDDDLTGEVIYWNEDNDVDEDVCPVCGKGVPNYEVSSFTSWDRMVMERSCDACGSTFRHVFGVAHTIIDIDGRFDEEE